MKNCKIIERLFEFSNNDDFSLKYSVQRKHSSLGSGGNGDVRRATCVEDGMPVALKCLHKNAQEDNEKRLRFKDEIETMLQAGKKVTGIIPILDYSISACWYVMPIADSIDNHLGNINEIINGVLQIAETLVEIHEMGLSHRDIKPANMLYYENRWVLCDFGLVDIPDNPNNLTKNTKRIGAVRTIAPEMSRFPKDADGKKADVYSLAKSLWMLLTKNSDSFEGHYVVIDDSISLHNYDHLKKYHLVEIDELLDNATKNDPDERPNMKQFVSKLKDWQNVKDDIWKQQISCWSFLKKYLFVGDGPQRCVWEDHVEISRVMNVISSLPINSHLFFPNNGWVEYKKVETASEPGCLDIYTQFAVYRIKLGKLIYESFNIQSYWNYFMLEAEPMEVLVGTEYDEYEERVIEDKPNHYVSAVDAIYGVYDYDSGQKLPNGAKLIKRCLKGKYLLVLKQGPYNQISQMDDGRHANCTNDTFREYVESLQKLYILHKMIDDSAWKKMFRDLVDSCPFKPTRALPVTELNKVEYEVDYVKNNLSSLSFNTILGRYADTPIGKAKYRFVFHFENSIDIFDNIINNTSMYLCKDGYIRKLLSDSDEIFEIADRRCAMKIFEELENRIKEYFKGKVSEFEIPYFSVEIIKISNPEYIFTIDDIRLLMEQADDRVDNTLVIDENGYAKILTDWSNAQFYPVINETWCQRRNYVGRYSKLLDLDSAYHYLLGKLKDYLKTGFGQSKDDHDEYFESTEELLSIIRSIIVK